MGIFGGRDKSQKMSKKEYQAFLDSCYEELRRKQDILINEYHMGSFEDFWFDQEAKTLQFKNGNAVGLEFYVVLIGSWSGKSNTWMWGWANESVVEEMRVESSKIKELTTLTGNAIFEKTGFVADEYNAHELVAMAVHHLGALGMYSAPSDMRKTYLALMRTV